MAPVICLCILTTCQNEQKVVSHKLVNAQVTGDV